MKLILAMLFVCGLAYADQRYNVQGYNSAIDSATAEDVWSNSAAYPFPTSATTTVVTSSNTSDTAAGTGAQTVKVWGLDSNLKSVYETVTMNGTSNVTMTNQLLRVNQVDVVTAGSHAANVGTISVKQSTTVIGEVPADLNLSQAAVFTTPANFNNWQVTKVYYSITNAVVGSVTFKIWTRKSGGLWKLRWASAVYGTSPQGSAELESPIDLGPGEDVRLQAVTTANSTAVVGGFDVIGSSRPL